MVYFQSMKNTLFVISSLILVHVATSLPARGIDVPSGPPLPPSQTQVAIVGAGLSGLATAYGLKKAGIQYVILEINPKVGGRVQTMHYHLPGGEVRADYGMEEYWESNPAVALLNELRLPVSSDVAVSSLVLGGKLTTLGDEDPVTYQKRILSEAEFKRLEDFKTKNVAPLLAKLDALTAHKSIQNDPELAKLVKLSFADWVTRTLKITGHLADWIRVSIECEIATSWKQVSVLDGIAEFRIFLGKGEKSYRVIGGNERFTDALADAVGREHIFTSKRVTRIEDQGIKGAHRVRISYWDAASSHTRVIEAAHVVTTIPLFRLFEVQFVPALSPQRQKAIDTMTWGSYFKAHIFVPPSAARFWTKNGQSYLPILSDSNLGVIYDGNPDTPDHKDPIKVVSLLVHGDAAERFNLSSLDEVRKEITLGLENFWPGFSKEIHEMYFYRYHPRAVGSWPVGRSRFDSLSELMRKPEGAIHFSGDFTEGSHSDGAFHSATRAVRDILESLKLKK